MFQFVKWVILVFGVGALLLYFIYDLAVIPFILGLTASITKIVLANKGYKSPIATIGSYCGVVAVVVSLIQIIL